MEIIEILTYMFAVFSVHQRCFHIIEGEREIINAFLSLSYRSIYLGLGLQVMESGIIILKKP